MATYNDIFHLHKKYLEYILEKSSFSHNYVKNISESGGDIETEIRDIFKKVLPSRFRVTHGYIASSTDITTTPAVSPQVDMIIVDAMVCNSLFKISDNGYEIVPIEAVVGVFEIKSRLNKTSLFGTKKKKGAIQHLSDICSSVGISKYDPSEYITSAVEAGKGINGVFNSNPIIGIIGIDHSDSLINSKSGNTLIKLMNTSTVQLDLDIITSFGGIMYGLVNHKPPHNWNIELVRKKGMQYPYGIRVVDKSTTHIHILARSIGYIIYYLTHTCGKRVPLENYYFNNCI